MSASLQRLYRIVISPDVVCLLLIALADWLFYGEPVGWTVSIFGGALLGVLLLRHRRILDSTRGRAVVATLAGLFIAGVVEPAPLVLAMMSVGLIAVASLNRNSWPSEVSEWYRRLLDFAGALILQPIHDMGTRWRRRGRSLGLESLWRVAPWVLPIVLLLVFLALFYAANPLVERSIDRTLDSWTNAALRFARSIGVGRPLLWVGVLIPTWTLLRMRWRRRKPVSQDQPSERGIPEWLLSGRTVVWSLAAFNAIFALHGILDAFYLWGGVALPDGMTYAEYAHRGAYPLVATALLSGGFVLAAFGRGGVAEQVFWARRLVYLWVAQNIFLVSSAMARLDMYVGVYGLTRLRLAAGIWMALVALGLVLIVYRIVRDRSSNWLFGANTLAALAVLYASCFVNFSGMIASYNVSHCAEVGGRGVEIDLDYLEGLGPEAIPALRMLERHAADDQTAAIARSLETKLEFELREQLADWRGWTWRRAKLARIVQDSP